MLQNRMTRTKLLRSKPRAMPNEDCLLWNLDVEQVIRALPNQPIWDLVITSPPYNLGKDYETKATLENYTAWQTRIIEALVPRLNANASVCWQVGNFVENGHIAPLDYIFHPIFTRLGLKLRNRIIWRYGHGLHHRRRFSGRYEVVLWYTKSDDYVFNLDAVRVPPKYPGKKAYKGKNAGKFSGNPLGKNPEDVWDVAEAVEDVWNIPNVKAQHVEKTKHPCQFPVGLAERLVLALSNPGDLVFDPFAGVGTTGIASMVHGRRFWGCELDERYAKLAKLRVAGAVSGKTRFRSHARPLYDHMNSPLSVRIEDPA